MLESACILNIKRYQVKIDVLTSLPLRFHGCEVRLDYDGQSAFEKAHAFRPGAPFLDLDLPKMDGYDVARRLRIELVMRDMTSMAMTGYGQK
jgi:CheY-like chemotaxis protein